MSPRFSIQVSGTNFIAHTPPDFQCRFGGAVAAVHASY
jgi:hypothetical protein